MASSIDPTSTRLVAHDPIVVANTLWKSTNPAAYDGGRRGQWAERPIGPTVPDRI